MSDSAGDSRSRSQWSGPRKRSSDGQVHCSFCQKDQKSVKKLIAGPGVYICDECVDLCRDIIVEEVGPVERLPASMQGTVSAGLKALAEQAEQFARDARGLAQFVDDESDGPDGGSST